MEWQTRTLASFLSMVGSMWSGDGGHIMMEAVEKIAMIPAEEKPDQPEHWPEEPQIVRVADLAELPDGPEGEQVGSEGGTDVAMAGQKGSAERLMSLMGGALRR